ASLNVAAETRSSSGGELELGCGFGGSALASVGGFEFAPFAFGGAVAVADVVGERVAEGVPVEVVGVLADELVDRAEGGLDPVEVAGVGLGSARARCCWRRRSDGSRASSGWRGRPGSSRCAAAWGRRAGSVS